MAEINSTIDVFCKAVRSVGIPKNQERKIESTFARLLQNSGQQWLSQRLKLIEQEATDSMANPQHDTIPNLPFRKSAKTNRNYRDDGINTLSQLSPEYRLTVSSVMRRSMQRPINIKDFRKAQKTIQSKPLEVSDYYHNLIPPLSKHKLDLIESAIKSKFQKKDLFSFSMLKASVTPSGVKIAEAYKDKNGIDKFRPITRNYVKAWELEIDQTPQQARYSALALSNLLKTNSIDNPNVKTLSFLGKNVLRHTRDDTANQYGSIGFIPQPGLKTRVVANVNRTVNAMLVPFGESVQQIMDYNKHSGVKDQTSTHLWAKSMLSKGIEIQSVDMTAATDLLDKSIYYDLFRNIDANEHPYLNESLRLFMASTDGKYTSRFGDLSFTRGQPLGARPSFPLLTLANIALAKCAEEDAGLDPTKMNFMVVGDDIAMRSEMTDYYADLLKAFGGDPNLDKSLKSSKMVEITGRLVTVNQFLRPKVRYSNEMDIPNPKEREVVNGLKGLRITSEVRKLFKSVSKQAIEGVNDNELLLVNQVPLTANKDSYSLLRKTQLEAISSVIAENASVPKSRTISKSGLISRYNETPMHNSLTNVDKADINLMRKISSRKSVQLAEKLISDNVDDKGEVLNAYPDQIDMPTPTVRKGVKTSNAYRTLSQREKLGSMDKGEMTIGGQKFIFNHSQLWLRDSANDSEHEVDLSPDVRVRQINLIAKAITKNLNNLDLSKSQKDSMRQIISGHTNPRTEPLPQDVADKISALLPNRKMEDVPAAEPLLTGSTLALHHYLNYGYDTKVPIPTLNNESNHYLHYMDMNGEPSSIPSTRDIRDSNDMLVRNLKRYHERQSSVPERHTRKSQSKSNDLGPER